MTPRWERRFLAPMITHPDWSPASPSRVAYESTESGVWQLHVADLDAGVRRQVTDHPVGVVSGAWSPDGTEICWWQDETGDESGRWYAQAFEGGDARPLFPSLDPGWNEGIAWVPGMLAVSISGHDGFAVYVSEDGGVTAKEVARRTDHIRVAGRAGGYNRGGLSADGSLLCLQHAELGDEMHEALRVIDPRTGGTVADLVDEGKQLAVLGVVADRRRPSPRGRPRTRRDPAARDLGSRHGGVDGDHDRSGGRGLDRGLVAGRERPAALAAPRRPVPAPSIRDRDRRALQDRASRGSGGVGAGATGRRRLVPAFER